MTGFFEANFAAHGRADPDRGIINPGGGCRMTQGKGRDSLVRCELTALGDYSPARDGGRKRALLFQIAR